MTLKKWKMNLKEIWRNQENLLQERVVREPVDTVSGVDCFVGLVRPTGAKMFQLDLSVKTSVHSNYLKRFRGIAIEVIQTEDNKKQFTIFLMEDSLEDVFILFLEDVISSLALVTNESEALVSIHARVNHWKDLFAKLSSETLPPERQRGLYGELLILKHLLTNSGNKQQILFAWQGPHGGNHDFVLNETALEVKTTKAGSPTLGISNEMQLDHSGWKALFISLVVLAEIKGGGATLSALIDELREELNDDLELVSLFLSKLELAGVPQDMLDSYDEIGYHVRAIRHFHVTDGFPSIIPNDIPDAVSEVRYKVEIAGCLDFETDEQSLFSFFQ